MCQFPSSSSKLNEIQSFMSERELLFEMKPQSVFLCVHRTMLFIRLNERECECVFFYPFNGGSFFWCILRHSNFQLNFIDFSVLCIPVSIFSFHISKWKHFVVFCVTNFKFSTILFWLIKKYYGKIEFLIRFKHLTIQHIQFYIKKSRSNEWAKGWYFAFHIQGLS